MFLSVFNRRRRGEKDVGVDLVEGLGCVAGDDIYNCFDLAIEDL